MVTEVERINMLHVHFIQLLRDLKKDFNLTGNAVNIFFNYYLMRTDANVEPPADLALHEERLGQVVYRVGLWLSQFDCSIDELTYLINQTDFHRWVAK